MSATGVASGGFLASTTRRAKSRSDTTPTRAVSIHYHEEADILVLHNLQRRQNIIDRIYGP